MNRDDDKTWAELVDAFHSSPSSGADQPWPAAEEVGPDNRLDDLPEDFAERLRDGLRPDGSRPDGTDPDDFRLDGRSDGTEGGDTKDPEDDYRDTSVTLGPLAAVGSGRGSGRDEPRDDDAATGDAEPSDHFVPPTPAPIPRGDRVTRLAWAAVIVPPVALIIVAVMSWRPADEMVLFAVLAFVTGFVTLVARMRGRHPHDPDDGAVL